WELVADVPDEGRIEAIARSRLFGFPDEVILRVGEGDDGALIDMRSRSRLGRIDRGVNAKRVREFLNDLEKTLAGV
ncbi:MAG: DUF1499 domain-containing protein, partial [Thalassovita sp.]|nr:DUF1499 domain-containing protein [Thalassovita sp.]